MIELLLVLAAVVSLPAIFGAFIIVQMAVRLVRSVWRWVWCKNVGERGP